MVMSEFWHMTTSFLFSHETLGIHVISSRFGSTIMIAVNFPHKTTGWQPMFLVHNFIIMYTSL